MLSRSIVAVLFALCGEHAHAQPVTQATSCAMEFPLPEPTRDAFERIIVPTFAQPSAR